MDVPDQYCHRCQKPIGEEQWIMANRLVYHSACVQCDRCHRNLPAGNLDRKKVGEVEPKILGKFFCTTCFKAVKDLMEKKKRGKPREEPPRPKCSGCEKELKDKAISTQAEGGLEGAWCEDCAKCESEIGEEERCFQLLDLLWCPDCEFAYRNQRYNLQAMGCGPPTRTCV